jgi:ribosomal protein S18 acetylase RimI-like enzyme
MENNLVVRNAVSADVAAMQAFIFEHGANQWNFLPEDGVAAHLADIENGATQALLVMLGAELLGLATFMASKALSHYQAAATRGHGHGYVCEVVVHRAHAGQGIGARLLGEAIAQMAAQGVREIFIERHEENLASAGMMRKAGFVEIDLFDDHERRMSGSRRTSVSKLTV